MVCHCADCQTLTGSAFRANIQSIPGTFRIRRGEPKVYIKVADSGARRAHAFCPNCGTPIYATAAENPTRYSLRIGTLTQRAALGGPAREIWTKRRLAWVPRVAGAAQSDGQP
jgi:hypothetical protein